jgi:hypothetical protein
MSFYLYCIKCQKKFHSSSHCFLHWEFETTALITPTPTPVPTPKPKTKSQAQTTQVLYYNQYLGIYQKGPAYFNWLRFNTGR